MASVANRHSRRGTQRLFLAHRPGRLLRETLTESMRQAQALVYRNANMVEFRCLRRVVLFCNAALSGLMVFGFHTRSAHARISFTTCPCTSVSR